MRAKSVPYFKIKIATHRLLIRPYLLADFETCRAAHLGRRPAQSRFDEPIPTPSSSTYKKFKRRIEKQRLKGGAKTHFVFGVFERKTGACVGQIDLFVINHHLRWANIGYCIQNQYWRLGYATEATRLGLRIGFEMLQFHRIEAATEPANRLSIRVARKVGMDLEGKRKKFFPENGGIDLVVFGINAMDWKHTKRLKNS